MKVWGNHWPMLNVKNNDGTGSEIKVSIFKKEAKGGDDESEINYD